MESEKLLREHLLALLGGGNAHIKFDGAVKNFPVGKINTVLPNLPYSPWQLLEHMKIAQYDILDFIRNPKYKHMNWPEDYWPSKGKKATKKDWTKTIADFNRDSKELQSIVRNQRTDFYSKIPHGTGQTILREILLVADHNAYHLGEFLVVRRALGLWKN
jgi:hypothetical protein